MSHWCGWLIVVSWFGSPTDLSICLFFLWCICAIKIILHLLVTRIVDDTCLVVVLLLLLVMLLGCQTSTSSSRNMHFLLCGGSLLLHIHSLVCVMISYMHVCTLIISVGKMERLKNLKSASLKDMLYGIPSMLLIVSEYLSLRY